MEILNISLEYSLSIINNTLEHQVALVILCVGGGEVFLVCVVCTLRMWCVVCVCVLLP